MFRSWKIGSAFGIKVYVHWLFLLVPAYLLFDSWQAGESWELAALRIVMMVAIFTCVVLHEFGHALAARMFHIRTLDITILPIGGLARLERTSGRPAEELVIAIAGPAVNVVIAVVVFFAWGALGGYRLPTTATMVGPNFLFFVMASNVVLVIFNMIPAYPMDGGRVARSILAMIIPYDHATIIAGVMGQLIAVAFAIIGILYMWSLLLVAAFIFLVASNDIRIARLRLAYARDFPDEYARYKAYQRQTEQNNVRNREARSQT